MPKDITQLTNAFSFFANALSTIYEANQILESSALEPIEPAQALSKINSYYVQGTFEASDLKAALNNVAVEIPKGADKFTKSGLIPSGAHGDGVTVIIGFDDLQDVSLTLRFSSVKAPIELSVLEVQQ